MTREEADEIVGIRASARIRELRVDRTASTQVETTGRGQVVTRRDGLPPTGAEEGVTYRDVAVSVAITSGAPDEDPTPAGDGTGAMNV